MTNFLELPTDKAMAFRALCAESGIATQNFYGTTFGGGKVQRVAPKCSPEDFEVLKEMAREQKIN